MFYMGVKMTYKDLLLGAVILCGTPDLDDYAEYISAVLHLQMEELFKKNNFLRQHKGVEALSKVPDTLDITANFAYEDELSPAFKYGLASKLIMADRDMDEGLHGIYLNMYNDSLSAAMPLVEEGVVNV
ncbi:MAG: hypothetical protein RSE24_06545, partial [Oscillospiraceae bacterium]